MCGDLSKVMQEEMERGLGAQTGGLFFLSVHLPSQG